TGREYDPETGLYYYRARYYHPDLGRFLNRDPLLYDAGDLNLYAYCAGNPATRTDPDGRFFWVLFAIAAVAIIGTIAYKSKYGEPVSSPSLGESLIPIYGPSKAAINDYQSGRYIWGTVNTIFAVSDIFLVKAVFTGLGRGLLGRLGAREAAAAGARTAEAAGVRELSHYTTPVVKAAVEGAGETAGKIGSKWGVYATERATGSRVLQSLFTLQVPWRVGARIPIAGASLAHFERVRAIGIIGGWLRYGAKAWYTKVGSVVLREGAFEAGEILIRQSGKAVFRAATKEELRHAAHHAFLINYGLDLAIHAAARWRASFQGWLNGDRSSVFRLPGDEEER
ncbi:MAG TPA: RHS repeat-associated core domain-containing protein, partial [Humisphaera sp.]